MATLKVYTSSVASSQEIKKQQSHILDVLSSKKIDFVQIDVASDRENLTSMRTITGDPKALAPQIIRGDEHIGNYEAFVEAVEDANLSSFLKCPE